MTSNLQYFNIEGPSGRLEAVLSAPDQPLPISAIVCHPHPLYGGTMHNKVVTTLSKTLIDLGIPALRFNFRGVGASEGSYGEGWGETEDALAAADWMRGRYPGAALWLAGFSFGAYVATRVAALPEQGVQCLMTVAPPVNHFDFAGLTPSCPWVVAQGDKDEIVPSQEVLAWREALPNPPKLLYFQDTGHFFHGRLLELRQELSAYLSAEVLLRYNK